MNPEPVPSGTSLRAEQAGADDQGGDVDDRGAILLVDSDIRLFQLGQVAARRDGAQFGAGVLPRMVAGRGTEEVDPAEDDGDGEQQGQDRQQRGGRAGAAANRSGPGRIVVGHGGTSSVRGGVRGADSPEGIIGLGPSPSKRCAVAADWRG